MSDMEDPFVSALRTLLQQGGFTVYRAFSPEPDNPDSVIEALILARSPEMLETAALDVLRQKSKSVN